jgi:UDP-glucuronate 4-epimerase
MNNEDKLSRHVLVTGCAGFIGFHVAKALLEAGHHVVGVDCLNEYYDVNLKLARLNILTASKNFAFHKLDVANHTAMEHLWDIHPDISKIVHLAAQAGVRHSLKQPFDYIHSNVQGHLVMLELCRKKGIEHLVYASSSSVYGTNTKMPFSVEDKTDSPASLYGATKKADELMTTSYCHLYGVRATGLRFFTVYGPWGRPDMAAYLFAQAIVNGRPIQVFNHGDMKRDFTYVDDIVAGVLSVLNVERHAGEHKIYNLGNHRSEPLLRFIELVEKELGQACDKELLPLQDGDVKDTFADISEAQADFGFHPETTIEEGIPRFIQWFKQYHQIKEAA